MGYLHDVSLSRLISPFECAYTGTGTWTPTIAANLISNIRTAGLNWFKVSFPILVTSHSVAKKGARLDSIDTFYKISTQDMTLVAGLVVSKITLGVDGTACAGASVAVTQDAAHDSNAERKAIGDHTMTTTITTPVWVDNDEHFWAVLSITPGANGVVKFLGARINYTLRI